MNVSALLFMGAGAWMLSTKKQKRKSKCPILSSSGGSLAGFDYIEYVTKGANLDAPLPMLIYFHSLGTHPSKMAKLDLGTPMRVILPRGNESWGSGPAWWPMRSSNEDQETLAAYTALTSKQMAHFIEEIKRCRPTIGNPLLIGHSQGGHMVLATAAAAPGLVRAGLAASAWLPQSLWPKRMAPVLALHGTKDNVVPYARSKDFYERALASGLPISFYPIEGEGHELSGNLKVAWKSALEKLSESMVA